MDEQEMEARLEEQDVEDLKLATELMPETQIELSKFLLDPDAKRIWEEINKDLVLGYLSEKELIAVRELLELSGQFFFLDMKDCGMDLLRDTYSITNSSRAKLGFERKMQQSSFVKTSSERSFQNNSRKGWLR